MMLQHKKMLSPQPLNTLGVMWQLEPRFMFDGAAAATTAEVIISPQPDAPDTSTLAATTNGANSTSTDHSDPTADSTTSGVPDPAGQLVGYVLPGEPTNAVVFIDTSIDNYSEILAGIDPKVQVVLLDSHQDGVRQIATWLSGHEQINAIHIISHGSEGQLNLGTGILTRETMISQYAGELAAIQQSLSETADILIYGCNFSEGQAGEEAATLLSQLTGADVAASTDATGYAGLGGNWTLETQIGTIEAQIAVTDALQMNWVGLLDISTGLIGNWTFDTNADDSSGNNYNGTLTNGAAIDTTDATDIVGVAKLSLDGVNDYVDLSAHSANLAGLTQGTIAGWIKTTSTFETIFSISDTADTGSSAALFLGGSGYLTYEVRENGVLQLAVYRSSATINDGNWHHVAVTVGASGNSLYVDGVLATAGQLTYDAGNATTQSFFSSVTSLDSMAIGRNQGSGGGTWYTTGLIDDVRVYDRVLTGGDIAQLYTTSNDAPINVLPGAQSTNEDTSLVFSAGNGNQISITDPDSSGASFEVSVSVTNGSLTLAGTTGLTFTNGDGTADTTMTLRGTVTNINNALNGASFIPTADYSGGATLTIATRDSTLVSLDIDANLQARYTFEGTANDVAPGTAQNGTLGGNATYVTDGTRGQVLSLDGVNDYVQIAGRFGDPTNVTLSAWVNLTAADSLGSHVISLGDSVLLTVDEPSLGHGVSGVYYNGSTWVKLTTGEFIAGTGWHHVAYTFDNTNNTNTIYIDGAAVATATVAASDSISYTQGANSFIGKHGNGQTAFDFNGKIDDARVYNRALTASEVASLAADLSLTDTDTVAITVTPVNDAPVLVDSNLTFTVLEDAGAPVNGTAVGSPVSAFTGSITDPDGAVAKGIAIIGSTETNGTWYYTTDAGSTWLTIGAVSNSSALLLADTAGTRLYFAPNSNYNGNVFPGLIIRAWDQSSGVVGAKVDTSVQGGTTAFSLVGDTIDPTVIAVNDPPAFSNLDGTPTFMQGGAAVVLDANVTFTDPELASRNGGAGDYFGSSILLERSGGANANDVFSATGNLSPLVEGGNLVLSGVTMGSVTTNSGGTLLVTFDHNATSAQVNETLQSIAYSNTSAAPSPTIVINWDAGDGNDGSQGTGGILGTTGSTTVTITAANDAPTFSVGDGKTTTSFGSGWEFGKETILQPDGKILVAGYSNSSGSDDFSLARYNIDGTLDTSFGGGDGIALAGIVGRAETAVLQADGKIVLSGYTTNGGYQVCLVRFNTNGTLDTSFGGGDGIASSGVSGSAKDIALQADGKFLVATDLSNSNFNLMRFNSDGSLDTGFGGGSGYVSTDLAGGNDRADSLTIQSDGKVLLAGFGFNGTSFDFALVRYNTNGALDTSFNGTGKVLTDFGGNSSDTGNEVRVQADGKIVVAGWSDTGGTNDFAIARYNTNGTLDAGFGTGGKVTINLGGSDLAEGLTIQADGKLLVTGTAGINGNDFGLVRLDTNGSLDTTFSGDGIVTTDYTASSDDRAYSVVVQSDGHIVVSGTSRVSALGDYNYALTRYTSTGALDITFDPVNTLDGVPTYTEGGIPVVLDADVSIFDAELSALNNFSGATLTLARNGGANPEDVFSATGTLSLSSGNLIVSGTTIGTYSNSSGTLAFMFNSNATQTLVNSAMQQITYSNSSDTPPASAQINWMFNDGNSGSQGSGGALSATGSTTVAITAVNDAPTITNLSGDSLAYSEGAGAVVIEQGANALVADVDSANFDTGRLTVSIPSGGDSTEDVLSIRNQGTGANQIGVSGNTVTYGGVTIGTFTGGSNGSNLVITLNSSADATAVTALVKNITYENTDAVTPTAGARTVRYVLTDGDGGTSTNYDTTVTVSAVNDAPMLALDATNLLTNGSFESGGTDWTGNSGVEATTRPGDYGIPAPPDGTGFLEVEGANAPAGTESYVEQTFTTVVGQTYVVSLSAITRMDVNVQDRGAFSINGVEIGQFTTGTSWQDHAASFTATSTSSTLQIISKGSLSGTAPLAGDAGGLIIDHVQVVAVQTAAAYTEGGVPVVLAGTIRVFDAELSALNTFNGATLTLTRNGGANVEDVFSETGTLSLSSGNVIVSGTTIGTYSNSGGTLQLTFNASATNTLVNSAMQQIAYSNSSDAPPASVQINWTFNDGNSGGQGSGGALTATGSTIVTITGVNDAPVNTVPAAQSVAEDTGLALSGISVNDADGNLATVQLGVGNGTLTVTLSGAASITAGASGSASLTLSGSQADINATLASLTYQGLPNFNGADTLTVTSTDSNAVTDVDTVAITVSATNAPPPAPPILVPPPTPPTPTPVPMPTPMPAPAPTPAPASVLHHHSSDVSGAPTQNTGSGSLPIDTSTANNEKTAPKKSGNSDSIGKPEDPVFFRKNPAGNPGYMPERADTLTQPDYLERIYSALEPRKTTTTNLISEKKIEQIQDRVDAAFEEEEADNLLLAHVATGTGLSLITGITAWILRTGTFFASMLSVIPAWKSVDPLSIVIAADQEKSDNKEPENNHNNLSQSGINADNLFEKSRKSPD